MSFFARIRRRLASVALPCVAAVALVAFATPVHADEEEGSNLEEKLRKQMEEILELMGVNEKALLTLSSGKDAKTRDVDIEIPNPPPQEGATGNGGGSNSSGSSGNSGGNGGGESGSSGSNTAGGGNSAGGAGASGREAGRRAAEQIRELLEGGGAGSGMIPSQIEELIRSIPERQGSGQGQPNQGQGQGQGSEGSSSGDRRNNGRDASARDGRRQQNEQRDQSGANAEQPSGGQNQPQNGSESPDSPANEMGEPSPDDDKPNENPQDPEGRAWETQLPPEIREAIAGGREDTIPPKYRDLVRKYLKWLAENGRDGGR